MTWEEDLSIQQERLNAVAIETEDGLQRVEDNLKLIETALRDLEKVRTTIREYDYSTQTAKLLQFQKLNQDHRRRFHEAKEKIKKRQAELDRAFMKDEELRYKGIRG